MTKKKYTRPKVTTMKRKKVAAGTCISGGGAMYACNVGGAVL